MKNGKLEFKFKASMDFQQTLNLFEMHMVERRVSAIQKYLSYTAAQTMLEAVKGKIPDKPQFSNYRDALQVVQSGNPSNPSFTVFGESKKKQAADQKTDILLFKRINKRRPLPPEIQILMAYQPWTPDTLPFDVDTKFAQVIIRKTSAREAQAVRKARTDDKPRWQQALNKLGIQTISKKLDKPVEGVEDVAYTALRLEYGLGGTAGVAHWRPAMKTVEQRVKSICKSNELVGALLDWRDNSWKTWANLSAPNVSSSSVASSTAFEDKLG